MAFFIKNRIFTLAKINRCSTRFCGSTDYQRFSMSRQAGILNGYPVFQVRYIGAGPTKLVSIFSQNICRPIDDNLVIWRICSLHNGNIVGCAGAAEDCFVSLFDEERAIAGECAETCVSGQHILARQTATPGDSQGDDDHSQQTGPFQRVVRHLRKLELPNPHYG